MSDLTGQQKAAKLTWLLAQGGEYSTVEIAHMYSYTWAGAYKLMERLANVLPIVKDRQRNGKWRCMTT